MTKDLTSAIEVAHRATDPLRAVIYARVSTDEQAKGYGITYTTKRIVKHIKAKGWDYVDTYADEGVSGSLEAFRRDELSRLMTDARKNVRPFDVVVVYEERAIGRRNRAFWPWVWELEDLGVFVAIVKGDYNNTTPEGRSRMRKAADYAADEREKIRDRTQGGIQEKAEDGGFPGGSVPFGWRIENKGVKGESCYALDNGEGGEWHTLAAGRIEVVAAKGDFEVAAVALNRSRRLTRNGKLWTRQNLQARLMSEAVLKAQVTFRKPGRAKTDGEGSPLFGQSLVIKIPPAFTEDEVGELESAVVVGSVKRAPKSNGRIYPFSKRILSTCGSHYTGCAPGSRRRQYRCSGKTREYAGAKVCTCRQIDAEVLEKCVWDHLVQMLSDPAELKARAAEWVGLNSGMNVNFEERMAELDREIALKDKAIAAVMVATAMDGNSLQEAIKLATADLNAERAKLTSRRAEIAAWQEQNEKQASRAQDLQRLADSAAMRLKSYSLADMDEIIALMDVRLTLLEPVPEVTKCPVTDWFREAQREVPIWSDAAWAAAEPIIRARQKPDKRLPHSRVLEAMLFKAQHEARWTDLVEYGRPVSIRTVWSRWLKIGLWGEIMDALRGEASEPVAGVHKLPRLRLEGAIIPGLIIGHHRALDDTTPMGRAVAPMV